MVSASIFRELLIHVLKMKSPALLLLGLCFALVSCVKQDTTTQRSNSFASIISKSYPFTININPTDSSYFEHDIIIDLSAGEFFVDNFSGIIGYSLEQVKFTISNYEGNELSACDFIFSYINDVGTIGNPLIYSQVPLYEFSQSQNFIGITHGQTTQNLVNQSMNANKELIFHIEGNVNEKPAYFTAEVYIDIKMSGQ